MYEMSGKDTWLLSAQLLPRGKVSAHFNTRPGSARAKLTGILAYSFMHKTGNLSDVLKCDFDILKCDDTKQG